MNIKYIIAAGLLAFTVTTRAQNKQENMKFQEETLHLTTEWDKVFPQSDKVNHSKVTFHNRYGVTLAGSVCAGFGQARLPCHRLRPIFYG